jgi:hypothetical protein
MNRVLFIGCWAVAVLSGLATIYGIAIAIKDLQGPNRLIVPLKIDHEVDAQLFFDQGNGIRAEDCTTAKVPVRPELTEVAFDVPRVPIREIRFDPMPSAGRFRIGAPHLENASGRTIAKFPIAAVVPRQQIADLRREGDHWLGETTPDANDPQLMFGLGSPLRVGSPRIPWPEVLVTIAAVFAARAVKRRLDRTVSAPAK